MSKIKTSENYLREKHHTEAIARTTHDNFHPPTHDSTLPAVKERPFPKITKSDWIWLGEGCRRREVRQMETDTQVASSPARSMDPLPPLFTPLTHFPDRDPPPHAIVKVRYLLDTWHSTTSAPGRRSCFKEKVSHMGKSAVEDGY